MRPGAYLSLGVETTVVVTAHAATRMAERGVSPDLSGFRPTGRTRDGAVLWTNKAGQGLLVVERSGTGWESFTVLTAFTPEMIAAKAFADGNPRECEGQQLISGPRYAVDEQILAALDDPHSNKVRNIAARIGVNRELVQRRLLAMRDDGRVAKSASGKWRRVRKSGGGA